MFGLPCRAAFRSYASSPGTGLRSMSPYVQSSSISDTQYNKKIYIQYANNNSLNQPLPSNSHRRNNSLHRSSLFLRSLTHIQPTTTTPDHNLDLYIPDILIIITRIDYRTASIPFLLRQCLPGRQTRHLQSFAESAETATWVSGAVAHAVWEEGSPAAEIEGEEGFELVRGEFCQWEKLNAGLGDI